MLSTCIPSLIFTWWLFKWNCKCYKSWIVSCMFQVICQYKLGSRKEIIQKRDKSISKILMYIVGYGIGKHLTWQTLTVRTLVINSFLIAFGFFFNSLDVLLTKLNGEGKVHTKMIFIFIFMLFAKILSKKPLLFLFVLRT